MSSEVLSHLRVICRRVVQPLRRQEHRLSAGFRALRSRFYRRFWEAAASGIGAQVDGVDDDDLLRIRRDDRWTLVCDSEVMLDSHLGVKTVANKRVVTRLLHEAGFPAPRHIAYTLASIEEAVRFMRRQDGRVVVKPARGTGAGWGVTTGIRNESDLREASLRAAVYFTSPLLIEEEAAGSSFRMLYIGGRYVDAVRRDPPTVVGDGKHAIRELMTTATRRRRDAEGTMSLHPLDEDLDCVLRLREDGLSPSSTPPLGEHIEVKRVVNQNAALENHIVREQVHPSIVKRGAQLVSYLGLEFAGVDVMCSDITRPIGESDVCFNEINLLPGLHHHVLVAEQSERLPVGEMVLERVLATAPRAMARVASK